MRMEPRGRSTEMPAKWMKPFFSIVSLRYIIHRYLHRNRQVVWDRSGIKEIAGELQETVYILKGFNEDLYNTLCENTYEINQSSTRLKHKMDGRYDSPKFASHEGKNKWFQVLLHPLAVSSLFKIRIFLYLRQSYPIATGKGQLSGEVSVSWTTLEFNYYREGPSSIEIKSIWKYRGNYNCDCDCHYRPYLPFDRQNIPTIDILCLDHDRSGKLKCFFLEKDEGTIAYVKGFRKRGSLRIYPSVREEEAQQEKLDKEDKRRFDDDKEREEYEARFDSSDDETYKERYYPYYPQRRTKQTSKEQLQTQSIAPISHGDITLTERDSAITYPLLKEVANVIVLPEQTRGGDKVYSRDDVPRPEIPGHHYRNVTLYVPQGDMDLTCRMKVLENSEFAVPLQECLSANTVNALMEIINVMNKKGYQVGAATYHVGECPTISCFQGHLDKVIFDSPTVFVPVTGMFWTLVAHSSSDTVAIEHYPPLDATDSELTTHQEMFDEWKSALPEAGVNRRVRVENFLKRLPKRAALEMKIDCKHVLIKVFKCCPGSYLTFRADKYFHATIIPQQEDSRRLLILHKLEIENCTSTKKPAGGQLGSVPRKRLQPRTNEKVDYYINSVEDVTQERFQMIERGMEQQNHTYLARAIEKAGYNVFDMKRNGQSGYYGALLGLHDLGYWWKGVEWDQRQLDYTDVVPLRCDLSEYLLFWGDRLWDEEEKAGFRAEFGGNKEVWQRVVNNTYDKDADPKRYSDDSMLGFKFAHFDAYVHGYALAGFFQVRVVIHCVETKVNEATCRTLIFDTYKGNRACVTVVVEKKFSTLQECFAVCRPPNIDDRNVIPTIELMNVRWFEGEPWGQPFHIDPLEYQGRGWMQNRDSWFNHYFFLKRFVTE